MHSFGFVSYICTTTHARHSLGFVFVLSNSVSRLGLRRSAAVIMRDGCRRDSFQAPLRPVHKQSLSPTLQVPTVTPAALYTKRQVRALEAFRNPNGSRLSWGTIYHALWNKLRLRLCLKAAGYSLYLPPVCLQCMLGQNTSCLWEDGVSAM